MSRKEEDFVRDWLAGNGSRDDVKKEIQETVFILSPKHAPFPLKNVEHVFATLRKGPLAPLSHEETPEDVEILFSGTKIINSTPKANISEIFDGLQEGPLATKSEQKSPREESNITTLHLSWSVWGTVVAAAAVLLLLIQPLLHSPSMVTSFQENVQDTDQYPSFSRLDKVENQQEDLYVASPNVPKNNRVMKEGDIQASPAKKAESNQRERLEKNVLPKSRRGQADSLLDEVQKTAIVAPESESFFEIPSEADRGQKNPSPAFESEQNSKGFENGKADRTVDGRVLSLLRKEATQGKKIPRHAPFAHLNKEVLLSITQDADVQRMYWAAYELTIRYPQEQSYIESLLRLNIEISVEQKYLLILLGDLYRKQGKLQQAKRAYRRALLVK